MNQIVLAHTSCPDPSALPPLLHSLKEGLRRKLLFLLPSHIIWSQGGERWEELLLGLGREQVMCLSHGPLSGHNLPLKQAFSPFSLFIFPAGRLPSPVMQPVTGQIDSPNYILVLGPSHILLISINKIHSSLLNPRDNFWIGSVSGWGKQSPDKLAPLEALCGEGREETDPMETLL